MTVQKIEVSDPVLSTEEMYRITVERAKKLFLDGWVVTLGLSGKDSGATSVCLVEGLRQAVEINPSVGPLYVATTNTTLDNMVLHDYMLDLHEDMEAYGKANGLPIYCQELKPSLLNEPMVEYIGRGKLLRTPQTANNGRDCAIDWKIMPMDRFIKSLQKKHQTMKIVSISGSREDESVIRAANLAKRGESATEIVETGLGFSQAIIKDWTLDHVWGLFNACYFGEIPSYSERLVLMKKHYAAGNSGTCDLFAQNGTSVNKACGARFGCALCAMNKDDKSLEAQIVTEPETYGFMKPLNDLRKFMMDTLWDHNNRSKVGRQMKDGFIKVGTNQYSVEYRMQLLRYVLSFQQDLYDMHGYHPISLIDYEQLIVIQYHWAREGGEPFAGMALRIWNEIVIEGQRYEIPETTYCEQEETPTYRYFDLMDFMNQVDRNEVVGLDDETLDNVHRRRAKYFTRKGELQRVFHYEEAKTFEVDIANWKAGSFIESWFPAMLEEGHFENKCPTVILKALIESGVVKITKGSIARLHEDAKRSQALYWLIEERMVNIEKLIERYSVTEEQKNEIIAKRSLLKTKSEDNQIALF